MQRLESEINFDYDLGDIRKAKGCIMSIWRLPQNAHQTVLHLKDSLATLRGKGAFC